MFALYSDYVRWNFQSIAAQEDFATCEVDVLISLVQLDDLAIYDEMTLFHCLVRWVEAQDDQNENLIRQVFSYVRFPMMSPRQLADLLLCPLTQRYKEFFVERMAIGVAFQSGEHRFQLVSFRTANKEFSLMQAKWSTYLGRFCTRTLQSLIFLRLVFTPQRNGVPI